MKSCNIFKRYSEDQLLNLAVDSVSIILPNVRTAPIKEIENSIDQLLMIDHFSGLNKRAVLSATLKKYLNIPPAIFELSNQQINQQF